MLKLFLYLGDCQSQWQIVIITYLVYLSGAECLDMKILRGHTKMNEELTQEQTQYLKERGFISAVQRPPGDGPYPYLVLGRKSACVASSYFYKKSPCSMASDHSDANPLNTSPDELVGILEGLVADGMFLDGRLFHTKPGEPIPIYVVDLAWVEVGQMLVDKYK